MSKNKNIELFLATFLAVFSFLFAADILQTQAESLFFAREIKTHPPAFFIAQINQQSYSEPKTVQYCPILAKSAISAEVTGKNTGIPLRVVFQKNASQKMPIASLTKLMTGIVAAEFYHLTERIEVSTAAVRKEGEMGNLEVGEILRIEDLLHILLIESSNDAAYALTQPMGVGGFVELMNLKIKDMGLKNTYFFNPTGLEPDEPGREINYSSCQDLIKLAQHLLVEHPELLEILSKKEYPLYFESGVLHHTLKNTNELLGEIPEVIGGKTGWTEKAGGCLVVILEGKKPDSFLINVVLNSPDKFGDMRKLIDCLREQTLL